MPPPLLFSEAVLLFVFYWIQGVLAALGVHRVWLMLQPVGSHRPVPAEPKVWPPVLIQLPLYNEPAVAVRLLRACAAMEYPGGLRIQVLDDSTDGTSALLAAEIARLLTAGDSQGREVRAITIDHVRRNDREGFKAGALAAGLASTDEEVVALFDSDFVPPADFLLRTIPSLLTDGVGFVQARWGHLNEEQSPLTRAQATLLDGHFLIEHRARSANGFIFNFNGTAGVWRRSAIEAAGGWAHDTLTEDFDLSYRARMAGWRGEYLSDVVAPAELPASWNALRSQQARWARGSIQCARKLFVPLWRSGLPVYTKIEATVPLVANFAWVLLLCLMLLQLPVLWLRQKAGLWSLLWVDLALLGPATLAFFAVYIHAGRLRGFSFGRSVGRAFRALLLGIAISTNNARAAIRGLFGTVGTFQRTPKTGGISASGSNGGASLVPSFEALLFIYLVFTAAWSCVIGVWAAAPFTLFFAAGVGWAAWGRQAGTRK